MAAVQSLGAGPGTRGLMDRERGKRWEARWGRGGPERSGGLVCHREPRSAREANRIQGDTGGLGGKAQGQDHTFEHFLGHPGKGRDLDR